VRAVERSGGEVDAASRRDGAWRPGCSSMTGAMGKSDYGMLQRYVRPAT